MHRATLPLIFTFITSSERRTVNDELGKVWKSIEAGYPKISCGLPQSFQANAEIVTRNRPRPLQLPFLFNLSYTVTLPFEKSLINKPRNTYGDYVDMIQQAFCECDHKSQNLSDRTVRHASPIKSDPLRVVGLLVEPINLQPEHTKGKT
jgi:hypothetical protein